MTRNGTQLRKPLVKCRITKFEKKAAAPDGGVNRESQQEGKKILQLCSDEIDL